MIEDPIDLVDPGTFAHFFERARSENERIAEATSEYAYDGDRLHFLRVESRGGSGPLQAYGFAVGSEGELVYVFSTIPGKGSTIVRQAIKHGATYLDCFEGYLPSLYARHGFSVTEIVENWTPGGPRVVYMALPDAFYPHPDTCVCSDCME